VPNISYSIAFPCSFNALLAVCIRSISRRLTQTARWV
jgi:hypothetical protein